jgi:sporulation protein YlmC with PRC-barrel domain
MHTKHPLSRTLFNVFFVIITGDKGENMKLSEIYRMDIYSDSGQYLGEVQDIIVDLEKGEVSRLLMVPMKSVKTDMRRTLMQKSVLYKSVKNVVDVVLVSAPSVTGQETSKEEVSDLTK